MSWQSSCSQAACRCPLGLSAQVVVDQIPPNVLTSNCVTRTYDFLTCSEAELHDISIPISVQVGAGGGVCCVDAIFSV